MKRVGAKHKWIRPHKLWMSQPKRIVDLKDYASKLLSEIDEEVRQKTEQIERLKAEVEELKKQRDMIQQILATIEQLGAAARQQGVTVRAQVELPKEGAEETRQTRVEPQPSPQPSLGPVAQAAPQAETKRVEQAETPQPAQPVQRPISPRPFNGERRWEPIVVNNTEYAAYSVSPTTIHLVFRFGVPADSKYVRGFIIDKYLQKMKEEAAARLARGEISQDEAFSFEIKTNEKGEIVEVKIINYAHEQLQDLLNKIKWFVASEVRDLRAKGRLT